MMSSIATSQATSPPCIHSFHFLQDALLPDFLTSRSGEARGASMAMLAGRVSQFATQNPEKFFAISTFVVLGGLPIIGFLAYAVATIIASLIGAVVLELILLGIGITGLAFVLFFVTCITVGATAVFMAVYHSYQAASKTWRKRSPWPVQPPTTTGQNDDTQPPSTSTEQSQETYDKTK